MLRLALLLCLLTLPLKAEDVVLGLSHDKVAITTTFDGSELLIFGAIKREVPVPEDPLGVIVTVAGPSQSITVRRKDRRAGIWVNTESVVIDSAPSFYAVATTAPLNKMLTEAQDQTHKISIGRAIRAKSIAYSVHDDSRFTEAAIRIRASQGAYKLLEGEVKLDQQTLFRTTITLPANLTEGDYETKIYLTRKNRVIAELDSVIIVHKVGMERWLFTLSREQPLAYGILAVVIAVIAGWGASSIFQMLRRG